MPTPNSSLKTFVLTMLVAAGGAAFAQNEAQWYGGHATGFWGLNNSVGVRGRLPLMFNPPGSNPDSLNALRQYGGYRITNSFAIEGSKTRFGSGSSGCNGDSSASETYDSCYGSAWSLAGIATLPVQSGFSVYGKLGLHYWQKGMQDESNGRHATDDPGGFGKVYGIGLSYEWSKSITVHAESERHSELAGNSASGANAGFGLDSSVHSIGLSVKF